MGWSTHSISPIGDLTAVWEYICCFWLATAATLCKQEPPFRPWPYPVLHLGDHTRQLLAHPTPHPKCMNCLSPIFPTNENQYTLLQRAGTHCYGADLTFPFTRAIGWEQRMVSQFMIMLAWNVLESSILYVYIHRERESLLPQPPAGGYFQLPFPMLKPQDICWACPASPRAFEHHLAAGIVMPLHWA